MNGRAVKGGKASLAEAGVREPFIVNCPSLVPAGVKTDALTDFTDMIPTFAELAGARLPGDVIIDGRSIAKLISGKKKDSDRRWIMAMGFGPAKIADGRVKTKKTFTDRVVRDKRYKLWVENGKSLKLFEILSDPAEKNNIIDNPDLKVAAARTKLEAVVQSFPRTDASPKYDPTPPQPWDRKPKTTKKSKKKTGN
jgi:arylsulfatase A-like enzyme